MLLTDVRLVENLQVISESTGTGKPMKVRGIFQRADEANNNGRIYPQKVLESAINNLIEAVQERRCVGELDHPTYDMVKLSNASHIITSLRFEGKDVIGEAEILSTPAGKVVEALIRDGIKIGISSRGMGTLSEGKGHKIVNEDFKLLTFDIVADPSTRGAFPTLAESKNYNSKLVENTIKKVVGRNVFLSMLEAKIDNKLDELRVDEVKDKRAGDPCWKNYKQVGMKMKGGRKVPNCVPANESTVEEANLLDKGLSDKEKREKRLDRATKTKFKLGGMYKFMNDIRKSKINHPLVAQWDKEAVELGKKSQRNDASNMYEKFAGKFIQEMKSCGYGKPAKKNGGKK